MLGAINTSHFTAAYELDDKCLANSRSNDLEISKISDGGSLNRKLELIADNSPYFFPFDRRILRLNTSLKLVKHLNDFQGESNDIIKYIAPGMIVNLDSQVWESNVVFSYDEDFLAPSTGFTIPSQTTIYMKFQRPFSLKIITIVIMSFLTATIILLAKIDDLGNFLEVATSILLGLWGIREILIPDYITITTIVHTLILALYLLLAFIIFVRFIIKPSWRQHSLENRDEVNSLLQKQESSTNNLAEGKENDPIESIQSSSQTAIPKTTAKYLPLASILLSTLAFIVGWLKFKK
ncbi:MAG: hypothetical protein KC449_21130 [Anaerolineales bacterium]|nr:hypothetical protein [Anaerolineales bacterium]